MKCVMGMVRPTSGRVVAEIDGELHDLLALSTEAIVDRGIALVPEGRRLFPRLKERRRQLAGSMRGGEQQMLALGRALMSSPRMLLIDEPSVGLAPALVKRTIEKIQELKEGYQLTVLIAEQNFTQALRIADRGYVIVHGRIEFAGGSAKDLNDDELIRGFYLGA